MGYVDTDALYEALKKGKISMNQFMDKIVELDEKGGDGIKSFQEQAHNSCDSIGTAITNMGNRFKKGFASILEGLDNAAKNTSFGSIAGMINKFSESIVKFFDKVGKAVQRNETVKKTIEDMAGMLEKLEKKINGLSDEQLDKLVTIFINLAKAGPLLLIFGKVFSVIGGGLSKLGGTISSISGLFGEGGLLGSLGISSSAIPVIGVVIATLTAMAGAFMLVYKNSESVRNGIAKTLNHIKDKLVEVWKKIQPAIQRIKEAFTEAWDKIKEKLEEYGIAATEYADALQPIVDFILDSIVPAFNTFADILVWLIPIITNVITSFIEGQTQWERTLTALTKFIIDMPNKIKSFIEWIKNIPNMITQFIQSIPERISNTGETIKQKIIEFVTNIWNWLTTQISLIIQNIITLIQELPSKIGYIIGQIIGYIALFGINLWNWITTELPLIIAGIIQWFSELPGKIWEFLVNAIQKIIEWGSNTYNTSLQWISKTINSIIEWFRKLPSNIWTWLQNTINKVIEWGNNLSQRGRQAAADLISNIENIIKELPSKMFNWGKDMIQGMINGITSMFGKIEQTASNIGEKISQYIHFSRPDKGPLREYEKWMPDMMKGLATSLKGSESILSNETKRIANKIAGNFDLKNLYSQMQAKVNAETSRLSASITASSNISRVITVNTNINADVEIDKQKAGRLLAPSISKTIRTAGV